MRTATRWLSGAALGIGALVSAALMSAPLHSQLYFGQNQVQYDRLNWRVIETDHFQIHYYDKTAGIRDDIAKMTERSYARLSVLMGHQFREKKPVLVFASSTDFAQSNTFGDLGEGTGGVTDPLRQRMAQFITGDYASFEHVLQHEMVHVFTFDIFSRGRAGAGLGNLAMVNPPLWFMEGLAEYFSIGQKHPWTDAWIRDAVVNNTLPSILQMTERPDKYFPYRYGFSLWQYIGQRWGDEVIAEIMNSVPSIGIERAFRRELGVSTAQLSQDWKEAMQAKFLPAVAELDRPRSFAQPLLTQTRTGGDLTNLFVAPALSPDGQKIAYIAYGSLKKGEIFPDLYLANAVTGKREARLVKSATDPNFEQLRFIYSQASFSPDGKQLVFTSQRDGRDILNVMDVRSRDVVRRIDHKLDQMLSPAWSPDGKQLVFAGLKNGVSDLYIVNADGSGLKQLTNDRYGDMQPQWSPDGRTIVFTSDRSPDTDFEILKIGKWKIQTYNVASGEITLLPNQGGLNINPQWAPDGKSVAFISDRTGTANMFLYDFDAKEHYQLTNVVGAIGAIAEYSPAMSWARGADAIAFVYFEKGDHTIWRVENPRSLKKQPYRDAPRVVAGTTGGLTPGNAAAPGTTITGAPVASGTAGQPTTPNVPGGYMPNASVRDTSATRTSVYRAPLNGPRRSGDLQASILPHIANTVSITAMMDSFNFNLPDSTRYRDRKYRPRLMPEYISQPQIGFQQGGYLAGGAYGGTTLVFADLMNDRQLFISGSLNGTLADASLYLGFANLSRRLQYFTSFSNTPINFLSNQYYDPINDTQAYEVTEITRLVFRGLSLTTLYPLNRFTRVELGAQFENIEQQRWALSRPVDFQFGVAGDYTRLPNQHLASANNVSPSLALVTDNTIGSPIFYSPISGRRTRASVQPSFGSWAYTDFLLDARQYYPILFNYITFAARITANIATGRDAGRFPKWIGSPSYVRGYNRDITTAGFCSGLPTDNNEGCSGDETIGSRVAFANAEIRFPVLRLLSTGLPIPPIDGLIFGDAGAAWNAGQSIRWNAGDDYNFATERRVLKSYGFGFRTNLFNIAILRYDWAVPVTRKGQKGYGTFSLGVSY